MILKTLYKVIYPIWLYDSNNNRIYIENSNGSWIKQEYDSNNNRIYCEHSDGIIRGKRPNKNKIWKLINNFVSLYYNFKRNNK